MLNVSKWIKISLLIDVEEMEDLFSSIAPVCLYQVQKVTPKGEGIISIASFLKEYSAYIDSLKSGQMPPTLCAPVISVTDEALSVLPVEGQRQLYKPQLPVIQMQPSVICYSAADRSFRSQLFGSGAISWGVSLGYPQIYEDPKTHAIFPTRDLPNGPAFHTIQKWVRRNTSPTPVIVDGQKQNLPIRLGKTCFSWINAHPQLQTQGIKIDSRADSSPVC